MQVHLKHCNSVMCSALAPLNFEETHKTEITQMHLKHCNPCKGETCIVDEGGIVCIKKISKKDVEFAVNQLIDQ